jgi:hypothetical protein
MRKIKKSPDYKMVILVNINYFHILNLNPKIMKNFYPLILTAFLFASSCSSDSSHESIDEGNTQEVLDHHWETFVSNDLEGVMEDYTEESVLITPNATYSGLEEIRGNFINAFKAFPTGSAKLTLNNSIVVQDVGYILWEADAPEFNLTYATDTFIIRNGKILRQTYAGVTEPK